MEPTLTRVDVSDESADLLRRLVARHGPVMFHQSGGCCDGSSPMCYPQGEFQTGDADVHLGDLDVGLHAPADAGRGGANPGGADRAQGSRVPFWMSRSQYEYWKHTHLTVDVVRGRGSGFSLEAPEGMRFLIRSRLMSEAELMEFGLL